MILNSSKTRQANVGYIYFTVLQSLNDAEKKTSRKKPFWFTSSPSIVVIDRHLVVRTPLSSDLNRLVKGICRISRLIPTHFNFERVELAKNWIITPVGESVVGGNSSACLNLLQRWARDGAIQ